MNEIIEFLSEYQILIILALLVLVVVLIIIVISSLISISKLKDKYRKIMRGTNNRNLEELLVNSLDKIDDMYKATEQVKVICDETSNAVTSCVQKVAIQRYKAFEDIGSDLSYSIAMLDGFNNGVIITSIYSRNESITYAKPIDNGISRYDLSKEEENVLHQAINTNNNK
ncbi:DUF4446 family protein [Clostridium sp.]|uniref:DUF4446 family protein n=1 Tax=Clostridium sp. TaxID=1506 RepID=UPI0032179352